MCSRRSTSRGRTGLVVSVRGGGHSAPGYGTNDGGLVIDLSPMKGIRVDPAARTARAQGGVLWRELDHETQAFGLATTGGTVSNTGIAGLTLGGGLGWLMGKHGLTVDNLLSADVVTADGQFRTASAKENPDLFWALRGGGGNFGVVTSFEYRLHPVTQVLGGLVIYPLDQAREVLRFYRDFCRRLPDEAEAYCGLLTSPEGMPVVGADPRLQRPDRGRREGPGAGAPVRAARRRPRRADAVRARQTMLDEPNADARPAPLLALGLHGADLGRADRRAGGGRGELQLTAQRADLLLHARRRDARPADRDRVRGAPAPVGLRCHRAVDGRRRSPQSTSPGCARSGTDWSRTWRAAPTSTIWPRTIGRRRCARRSGENYGRLRQLKAVYDPTNLFRINANIAPAG